MYSVCFSNGHRHTHKKNEKNKNAQLENPFNKLTSFYIIDRIQELFQENLFQELLYLKKLNLFSKEMFHVMRINIKY